tara:strand:+ start:276 stop:602 length:327 start_codon:yes stop_codon:yes gene_type:complete
LQLIESIPSEGDVLIQLLPAVIATATLAGFLFDVLGDLFDASELRRHMDEIPRPIDTWELFHRASKYPRRVKVADSVTFGKNWSLQIVPPSPSQHPPSLDGVPAMTFT